MGLHSVTKDKIKTLMIRGIPGIRQLSERYDNVQRVKYQCVSIVRLVGTKYLVVSSTYNKINDEFRTFSTASSLTMVLNIIVALS